jgi:hypothetical protein
MSETIIKVSKATICFTTCDYCMGELVKQLYEFPDIKFYHGEIQLKAFDHIYAKMLIEKKQNLIQINCPHNNSSNLKYYLTGEAKLFLGEFLLRDMRDYQNAGLILKLKPHMRRKLLNRYHHMLYL